MKYSLIILAFPIIVNACGKEKMPTTPIPCCTQGSNGESCDTVPHKYELIWHTPFHPKSGRSVSSTPIIHGNAIITSYLSSDADYSVVQGYNSSSGEHLWTWNQYEYGLEFLHDKYTQFKYKNDLILSFVNSVYSINPLNGQTNWSFSKKSNGMKTVPGINIIGNFLYYGSKYQSDSDFRTYLLRKDVNGFGEFEIIYEYEDTTSVNLIFSYPSMYINHFMDTCLVFIGKGYHVSDPSKDKTVYHALNISSNKKLWSIEFIRGDGLSMPPIIYKNKVIIAPTSNSIVCLDASSGTIIWHNQLPDPGFMQSGDIILEENVLLVLNNMGTLYAFDPETGVEIWKQQTAEWASSPVKMEAHKGILYVANGGLGCQLSAWDVHTGENYWCEYSVNAICKPDCYISSSGLSIDKERGLLYTTDGYDILCIKTIR